MKRSIIQTTKETVDKGCIVSNEFTERPYLQDYEYNAFGDMTERKNGIWSSGQITHDYTFTNHRISGWTYDADGRVTHTAHPEPVAESKYDAAGRLAFNHNIDEPDEREDKATLYYDGDGRQMRRSTEGCRFLISFPPPEDPPDTCEWIHQRETYLIRSSVLGGEVIVEAGGSGTKRYVYAGGTRLAELTYWLEFPGGPTGVAYDAVQYYHNDAAGVSQRVTRNSPEALLGQPSYNPNYIDPRQTESDTFGTNVGIVPQYIQYPAPSTDPPMPRINIEGNHPQDNRAFGRRGLAGSRTSDPAITLPEERVEVKIDPQPPEFVDPSQDGYVSSRASIGSSLGSKLLISLPNLCDFLRRDLSAYLSFFDEIWEASKSGTSDSKEQGGLIGIDFSGNITPGRGREDPIVERFMGTTYKETMGLEFSKWVQGRLADARQVASGSKTYLYYVHTHPVSGSTMPSGRKLPDGSERGDKPASREFGLDGIIVTKDRIGVFNEAGRYCEFKRTTTSLSPVGK